MKRMHKMMIIAVREYLAAVRTKAFIISLIVMPILMGGSAFMQWLLSDFHDTGPKTFAVVDRTPGEQLFEKIKKIAEEYKNPPFKIEQVAPSEKSDEQRAELSERVRKGELFGFLDIGAEVLEPPTSEVDDDKHRIRYQSNRPTNQTFQRLMKEKLVPEVQKLRFDREGLHTSFEKVSAIMKPVSIESKGLMRRNREGRIEDESQFAPVAVPMA